MSRMRERSERPSRPAATGKTDAPRAEPRERAIDLDRLIWDPEYRLEVARVLKSERGQG